MKKCLLCALKLPVFTTSAWAQESQGDDGVSQYTEEQYSEGAGDDQGAAPSQGEYYDDPSTPGEEDGRAGQAQGEGAQSSY